MITSSKFNKQPKLIYMWLWSSNQHDKIDWPSHWFGRKTRRNMLKVPLNKMKSMHTNMYAFMKVIGDDCFFFGGPYIIFILVWWRHYIHVWIVLCEPFAKENCPYSYQSNSCDFQSLNILNYLCFYLGPQTCKKVASFKLDIPIWFLIYKLIKCLAIGHRFERVKISNGGFSSVYFIGCFRSILCHKYIIV
jgi:hypothetical protein